MPALSRCLATRSAPRLVRVKTMARLTSRGRRTVRPAGRACASASTKQDAAGRRVSTVVAAGVTDTSAGLFSSSAASLPISPGMVAEKNRFWRCLGRLRDDLADRLAGSRGRASGRPRRARTPRSRRGWRPCSAEVVDQAAGGGHQHVDAGGQGADLRAVFHAAEDHRDGEAEVAAVAAEALGDLAGQLAGRAEHQHAAGAAGRRLGVGRQAMQDRQGEGGGLAGARLGDAEQVLALP